MQLTGSCAFARQASRSRERGHLLVGLVVLAAVMIILLTAAAQSWTFLIRRDREAELIFRGEQYAKAIQFYRKENNTFPLQLKLLIQKGPHGHRYIRHLFKDPLSKDGEWGKLYLSPTGKGYINPYASQINDSFLAGDTGQGIAGVGQPIPGLSQGGFGQPITGLGRGSSGFGRRAGGVGSRSRGGSGPQAAGYSELTPDEFGRIGGQTLPIVGVVHKKREFGVKVYKEQASLNDWAFTLMAQGQEINFGGGKTSRPKTGKRRVHGIGDSTAPIFLPHMLPPPEDAGKTGFVFEDYRREQREKLLEEERERQRQEEERQRLEEEERRRQEEAAEDQEDQGDQYYDDEEQDDAGDQQGEEASGDEEDSGDAGADSADPDQPASP